MRILIPVDGSEPSQGTLEWAVETLDLSKNSFVLLSVIVDEMIAEYRIEDATQVLDEARAFLERKGARVEKAEYVTGDAVERICQFAQDENVDQIMLGSHGRSGVARMLLGSVSEALLERCDRPVFIVRNKRKVYS